MKTIVVGAAHNYEWDNIKHWWMSLRLAGFDGDVHLFTYNDNWRLKNILRQVEIYEHRRNPSFGQAVIDRFYDVTDLMRDIDPETWVILTDTSDIVFQYDPNRFLAGVEQDIVVASEGVRFERNAWTLGNLATSFPNLLQQMKKLYYYNAGSMACKAGVLRDLGKAVYAMCDSNRYARNHDQAALNYLLQLDPEYKARTLFTGPDDLWCYCAASSMFAKPQDSASFEGKLPIVRNGKCYVHGGKELTCMFHHYTRDLPTRTQVYRWVQREWTIAQELA
jgi:hypothetical protein